MSRECPSHRERCFSAIAYSHCRTVRERRTPSCAPVATAYTMVEMLRAYKRRMTTRVAYLQAYELLLLAPTLRLEHL
jgi:hypothetical protein